MKIGDLLKSFNKNGADFESLVEVSAQARMLQDEFKQLNTEEPEWLTDASKAIRHEILDRQANTIAQRIRENKARLETLKSPSERKREIQQEIAELEAQRKEL